MNATIAVERTTLNPYRLSWGAIFAGLIMVLIVHAVLNFLSLAWGLANVSFSPEGIEVPQLNAFFWLLLNTIIAMFVGGWVAGRLSAVKQTTEMVLHGLLTWATASLLSLLLVMLMAGTLLSSAFNALGASVNWAGENVSALVNNTTPALIPPLQSAVQKTLPKWRSAFDTIQQQVEQVLDAAQKKANTPLAAKEYSHQ